MSRAGPPSDRDAASLPRDVPDPEAGEVVPRPVPAGGSAGIAMGRRAGRAQVTALVLSLRRRTEADAQEQLQWVRGQLELGRRTQAQFQRQLAEAEHELSVLATRPAHGVTAAHLLAEHSVRLVQQRQLVRERQVELAAQAAHVQALVQQQSELHEALRLALARREAAELYQAEERREQRRIKAQRQRTLEEEARDRFLSAQRQAKSPRR